MKKFLVIYHAPAEAMDKMKDVTPEEREAVMKPWMDWAAACGDGLIDLGTPLAGGQKVTPDGTSPSDKQVAGYSMLQAESMDEAVKMLEGHPHLSWTAGCEIEVHESMPLPS